MEDYLRAKKSLKSEVKKELKEMEKTYKKMRNPEYLFQKYLKEKYHDYFVKLNRKNSRKG